MGRHLERRPPPPCSGARRDSHFLARAPGITPADHRRQPARAFSLSTSPTQPRWKKCSIRKTSAPPCGWRTCAAWHCWPSPRPRVALGEYSPLEVKHSVVGYGRAEKHQVERMVRTLTGLDEKMETEDVSDALAVAICHATLVRSAGAEGLWRHSMIRWLTIAGTAARVRGVGCGGGWTACHVHQVLSRLRARLRFHRRSSATAKPTIKETPDDDPETFQLEDQAVATIFDLAEKLDHFKRPVESGLKVANMGAKTFRWEDGGAVQRGQIQLLSGSERAGAARRL